MRKVLFLLSIFFAALLQVSFWGAFTGSAAAPNFLLVFTLVLAFLSFEKESYWSAFWGGFFLDLLGLTSVVGLTGLSLVVVLILWRGVKRRAAPRWPLFLLYVWVVSFLGRTLPSYPWLFVGFSPALRAAGGDVLLTALCLPPLSVFCRYLFEEDHWQLDFRNRL